MVHEEVAESDSAPCETSPAEFALTSLVVQVECTAPAERDNLAQETLVEDAVVLATQDADLLHAESEGTPSISRNAEDEGSTPAAQSVKSAHGTLAEQAMSATDIAPSPKDKEGEIKTPTESHETSQEMSEEEKVLEQNTPFC